jgi:hypothetical protein
MVNTYEIKTGCTNFASNSIFSRLQPMESRECATQYGFFVASSQDAEVTQVRVLNNTSKLCDFLRVVLRIANGNSSSRKCYRKSFPLLRLLNCDICEFAGLL